MTDQSERRQTAWENLANCQRQLDMDGCEVGVSRQAIDETLAEIERLTAELALARAAQPWRPDREAVARIIESRAFEKEPGGRYRYRDYGEQQAKAFAKADTILALAPVEGDS